MPSSDKRCSTFIADLSPLCGTSVVGSGRVDQRASESRIPVAHYPQRRFASPSGQGACSRRHRARAERAAVRGPGTGEIAMKILNSQVYVGPNVYALFRVIRLTLDLGPLEEWPT